MNTSQEKYASKRMAIMASCVMILLSVTVLVVLLKVNIINAFDTSPINLMRKGETNAGVLKFLSRGYMYVGAIVIISLMSKRLCFYSLIPIPFITLAVAIYYGLFYPHGRQTDVLMLLLLMIPTAVWLFFLFRQKTYRAAVQKNIAIPVCVLGGILVILFLLIFLFEALRAVGIDIYF